MEYCMVRFVDESDAPGIVYRTWMNSEETLCLYPSVRTNEARDKLLKKKAKPSDNWHNCRVKVLRKYNSFNDARRHLMRAEDTSNLESEDEESSQLKKRKCTTVFREDDEEDDILYRKSSVNEVPVLEDFPTPPQSTPSTSTFQAVSSPSPLHRATPPSSHPFTLPLHTVLEPTPSIQRQNMVNAKLLSWLTDISSKMTRVEHKLDLLLGGGNHQLLPSQSAEISQFEGLPVEDKIQFDELDLKLATDTSFRQSLTKMLISLGGRDYKCLAQSMLKRTLNDCVAERFSMTGKMMKTAAQPKSSFLKTQLYIIIVLGCKNVFPELTEDRLKGVVGEWFHQAKFRILRRLQNAEKTQGAV